MQCSHLDQIRVTELPETIAGCSPWRSIVISVSLPGCAIRCASRVRSVRSGPRGASSSSGFA